MKLPTTSHEGEFFLYCCFVWYRQRSFIVPLLNAAGSCCTPTSRWSYFTLAVVPYVHVNFANFANYDASFSKKITKLATTSSLIEALLYGHVQLPSSRCAEFVGLHTDGVAINTYVDLAQAYCLRLYEKWIFFYG